MIELKNIFLSYKIKENKIKDVLKDINLVLPNKGLVFIVGKSGSGKSSLLSIMEGYLKPSRGLIKYKNKNINDNNFNIEKYYGMIGVLFQDFNLINDLTLKENIELLSNDKEKIDTLLEKYDLNKVKNNKIYNLSGGEKQRCALIRALIKDPSIIFADEPTGALDSFNSDLLMNDLYEISKDKLVVVVTHNEEFLSKYKSYYIKLEEGKIIENNLNIENVETDSNDTSKIKENFRLLSKRVIFSNLKLSIFSFLSLIFTYTILLFSVSFKTSFNSYSNSIINKYYSNNIFTCSKIISSKNNSYLKIIKKEKPKNDEIDDILKDKDIRYQLLPNLSYFLSPNKVIIDSNLYSNITFYPSINKNLIENEVVINDEFKNKYNLKEGDILNLKVNKSFNFYLKDSNDIFKEEIELSLEFKIKEVYNEFPFLNNPKIYYNYNYIYNVLEYQKAENLSKLLLKDLSLINLYDYSSLNQEIDSYSSYLYVEEFKKIITDDFQKEIKNKNYEIQNEAYVLTSSFLGIVDSLNLALIFLNGIIFITSIFLLIFINISIISQSKKDLSILFSLGFNKRKMIYPYFIKDFLCFLFSFVISYLITKLFINKMNLFIQNKYFLDFNLSLNNFYLLLIFLSSLLILIFISILISKNFNKISIYKELKEE